MDAKKYLPSIRSRASQSKAYQKHQHMGVEIATVLGDAKHTGLYIKLATQYNNEDLLRLAKEIAEYGTVKNKGAYFMKIYKDKVRLLSS